MKRKSSVVTCVFLIFLLTICNVFGEAETSRYIYVFSPDARFLKIDANSLRVIDVGNLWWLNIRQVDGIIEDPAGASILLKTRIWQLAGIENPTRSQFEMTGLVALQELYAQGRHSLAIQKVLRGPTGSSLDSGKVFDHHQPGIFLTWTAEDEGKQVITAVKYGRDFDRAATINNFGVYPRSCISSDETKIYTARVGMPREIEILDLEDMRIHTLSYHHIGGDDYFSKGIVASNGCLILVRTGYERTKRTEANSRIFLFDMEQQQLISQFQLQITGDFHIVLNGRFILIDQVDYVPLSESSARREKLGRLVVFDSLTGEQVASISVPPRGSVVEFSGSEDVAYYVSPGKITVLDLAAWTARSAVEIPFESAYLSLYRGN